MTPHEEDTHRVEVPELKVELTKALIRIQELERKILALGGETTRTPPTVAGKPPFRAEREVMDPVSGMTFTFTHHSDCDRPTPEEEHRRAATYLKSVTDLMERQHYLDAEDRKIGCGFTLTAPWSPPLDPLPTLDRIMMLGRLFP